MKTFVLMWNPAISCYKKEDFKEWLRLIGNDYSDLSADEDEEDCDCRISNWSVWEYEKAEFGDRFFLLRVGEGKTGIVLAGTFCSDPFEAEDWSGRGRKVCYVDLDWDTIVDPDLAPYVSTELLTAALPGFDWTGGHSGRLLDDDMAERLELLWTEYLYANRDIFDGKRAAQNICGEDFVSENLAEYLRRTRGDVCEVCGYDYKKLWGEDCDLHNVFMAFPPLREEQLPEDDNVWKHIHCVCRNCYAMEEEALREKLGE